MPILLKRIAATVFLKLALLFNTEAPGMTYTTTFPNNENPISENGRWTGGSIAGADVWGDVQSTQGLAFGVSQPTTYGDPTAIVKGAWGPDQTVQAIVSINTTPSGGYQEAEVRLRTSIDAKSITGYEVYGSVIPSNPYCHIASWGGPNGVWVNMASNSSRYLKGGDTITGTVSGTDPVTIKMFINGTLVLTAIDSGAYTFSDGKRYGPWNSGNPGIGFYNTQGTGWNRFGFAGFSASDGGAVAALPSAQSMLRKIDPGDLVEILDLKGRVLFKNYGNRNGHTFPARPLCTSGVRILKVVSGRNRAIQKMFLYR